MTNPQDPFAAPGGSPPSRPAQPPTWDQPSTPTWEQAPPAGGPPAFGEPAPGGWGAAPPHTERRNGLGTAALVLGLIGLFLSFFVIGGLLGLVAIVLGVLGLGRVKRREADNRGMAIAGIVLGALAVLVAGLVLAGAAALFNSDAGKELVECQTKAGSDQAALNACQQQFNESLTNG